VPLCMCKGDSVLVCPPQELRDLAIMHRPRLCRRMLQHKDGALEVRTRTKLCTPHRQKGDQDVGEELWEGVPFRQVSVKQSGHQREGQLALKEAVNPTESVY